MASEHSETGHLARAALTGLVVALVGTVHAGVCYLVVVRAVPPATLVGVAVALLAAGIVTMFRQSWQGGRTVAGWLLAAATTTLALAFVTTATGGPVSTGEGTVRVVVETVSTPIPVVLVGFERGATGVTQVGQVLGVGYALLAAGLWVHPGVGAVGDRLGRHL
ncbi:hypothetical protein GJ629_14600 [Halapricum sp. CBA1109]|uniref:hypothetical protein n=1 Tax=Halapricum sp. CBA1109 TaxID=2668068 RepID=UPI0012F7B10F|nr:hypothetical protein [Halapricum sp. CBA1109]MUV90968.1 hypothetical protein [Halapricum sp. CBA1109]